MNLEEQINQKQQDIQKHFLEEEMNLEKQVLELERQKPQILRNERFEDFDTTTPFVEFFNGRQVVITVREYGFCEDIVEEKLNFSSQRGTVKIRNAFFPICGEPCSVKQIVDVKTNTKIFDNTDAYLHAPFLQQAYCFGRLHALKSLDLNIAALKKQQKHLENHYQKQQTFLNDVSKLIEESKRYVEPQLFSEWQKTVVNSVDNCYCGKDVVVAFKAMKALENGASFERTEELVKSKKAKNLCLFESKVYKTVLWFAKEGPEFVESTDFYRNEYKRSSEAKQIDMDVTMETLKERNYQLKHENRNEKSFEI